MTTTRDHYLNEIKAIAAAAQPDAVQVAERELAEIDVELKRLLQGGNAGADGKPLAVRIHELIEQSTALYLQKVGAENEAAKVERAEAELVEAVDLLRVLAQHYLDTKRLRLRAQLLMEQMLNLEHAARTGHGGENYALTDKLTRLENAGVSFHAAVAAMDAYRAFYSEEIEPGLREIVPPPSLVGPHPDSNVYRVAAQQEAEAARAEQEPVSDPAAVQA